MSSGLLLNPSMVGGGAPPAGPTEVTGTAQAVFAALVALAQDQAAGAPSGSFVLPGTVGYQGDEGDLTVVTDTAVITRGPGTYDGVYFDRGLYLSGAGTYIFRNCIFEGTAASWLILAYDANLTGASTILIEDCTLRWKAGDAMDPGGQAAVQNLGVSLPITIRRCDISGKADGMQLAGNVVVEDTVVHDLVFAGTFPDNTHNDGLQFYAGTLDLVRCYFDVGALFPYSNSCVFFQGATIGAVRAESNYFNGGGFSYYAQNGQHRFINNTFGPDHLYGEFLFEGSGPTIVEWHGNVDSEGNPIGTTVNAPPTGIAAFGGLVATAAGSPSAVQLTGTAVATFGAFVGTAQGTIIGSGLGVATGAWGALSATAQGTPSAAQVTGTAAATLGALSAAASGGTFTAGSTLISDNFNRADANTLGANWQTMNGTIGIRSNLMSFGDLSGTATGGAGELQRHRTTTQVALEEPVVVEAKVVGFATGGYSDARIMARIGHDGTFTTWHMYELRVDSSGAAILNRIHGTTEESSHHTFESGMTYSFPETWRMEINGTNPVHIEVFRNGVSVGTFNDTDASRIPAGRYGGIGGFTSGGTGSVRMDDFRFADYQFV